MIRELFYGQTRFEAFVDSLGIPRNTLTDRLEILVGGGLVERNKYRVDPVRHEYRLTKQGRELFGVLAVINAWGDRWLTGSEGVPVVMRHDKCGHSLRPEVTCAECGEVLDADEVSLHLGPAYPAELANRPAIAARFRPREA